MQVISFEMKAYALRPLTLFLTFQLRVSDVIPAHWRPLFIWNLGIIEGMWVK